MPHAPTVTENLFQFPAHKVQREPSYIRICDLKTVLEQLRSIAASKFPQNQLELKCSECRYGTAEELLGNALIPCPNYFEIKLRVRNISKVIQSCYGSKFEALKKFKLWKLLKNQLENILKCSHWQVWIV